MVLSCIQSDKEITSVEESPSISNISRKKKLVKINFKLFFALSV